MMNTPKLLLAASAWLTVAMASGQAFADPAAPSADQKIKAAHHVHHAHRHHGMATAAARPAPAGPADRAVPGTQPAPVPNENVSDVPPGQAPDTQVTPSLLQLHYPHVGDGYVEGSSPSAIDDRNTAKAPGVEMQMPLK